MRPSGSSPLGTMAGKPGLNATSLKSPKAALPNVPTALEGMVKQAGEAEKIKAESLTNCVKITPEQVKELIKRYKQLEDNEARLAALEKDKLPHTFMSQNVLDIMGMTNSVKTKIAVLQMLAPRLLDPNAKLNAFQEVFSYATEKEKVAEILKKCAQQVASRRFTRGADVGNLLNVSPQSTGVGTGGALRRKSLAPKILSPNFSPTGAAGGGAQRKMSMGMGRGISMTTSNRSLNSPMTPRSPGGGLIPMATPTMSEESEADVDSESGVNTNTSNNSNSGGSGKHQHRPSGNGTPDADGSATPEQGLRRRSLSHASLADLVIVSEKDAAQTAEQRRVSRRDSSTGGSVKAKSTTDRRRSSSGPVNNSDVPGSSLAGSSHMQSLGKRVTNNTPFGESTPSAAASLFGIVSPQDGDGDGDGDGANAPNLDYDHPSHSPSDSDADSDHEPSRAIDGLDLYTTQDNMRASFRRASSTFMEKIEMPLSADDEAGDGTAPLRGSFIQKRRSSAQVQQIMDLQTTMDLQLKEDSKEGRNGSVNKPMLRRSSTAPTRELELSFSSPSASTRYPNSAYSAPGEKTDGLPHSPLPPMAGATRSRSLTAAGKPQFKWRKLPPTQVRIRPDSPTLAKIVPSIEPLLSVDFSDNEEEDEEDEEIRRMSFIQDLGPDMEEFKYMDAVSEDEADNSAPSENIDAVATAAAAEQLLKEEGETKAAADAKAAEDTPVKANDPAENVETDAENAKAVENAEAAEDAKAQAERQAAADALFAAAAQAISSAQAESTLKMAAKAATDAEAAEASKTTEVANPAEGTEATSAPAPIADGVNSGEEDEEDTFDNNPTDIKAIASMLDAKSSASKVSFPVPKTAVKSPKRSKSVFINGSAAEVPIWDTPQTLLEKMQQLIILNGRKYFHDMAPEKCLGLDDQTGLRLYSYMELIRQNVLKTDGKATDTGAEMTEALIKHQLENHLTTEEFAEVFNMDRTSFILLPLWKKVELKKSALLF